MDQSTFLRLAKRELHCSFARLSAEMGVSARTMEKWASPPQSPDRRAMPLIARKFLVRLLEERKRAQLAAGDRRAAEVIDAIAARIEPERLLGLLRDFDALQVAARKLAPWVMESSGKSRAFASFEEKNAWQRDEEAKNARRLRAASSRTR